MTPDVVVLIPAGGVGLRLGLRTPKQFLRIGAATILATTVRHFTRHPAVRAIVIAAPAAHLARTREAIARLAGRSAVEVVEGGATRQESVWRALQAAPPDADIVLVHDAVRPFITRATDRRDPRRRRRARCGALCAADRGDGQARGRRRGREHARSLARCGRCRRRRDSGRRCCARPTRRPGATGSWAPTTRCWSSVSATRCGWCLVWPRTSRSRRRPICARRGDAAEPRGLRLRPASARHGSALDPGRRDGRLGGRARRPLRRRRARRMPSARPCSARWRWGTSVAIFPTPTRATAGVSSLVLLRDVIELVRSRGGRLVNVDATVLAQAPAAGSPPARDGGAAGRRARGAGRLGQRQGQESGGARPGGPSRGHRRDGRGERGSAMTIVRISNRLGARPA